MAVYVTVESVYMGLRGPFLNISVSEKLEFFSHLKLCQNRTLNILNI